MGPARQHHEIFSRFTAFSGEVPPFSQVDFIGTTTRQEFVADLSCHPVTITRLNVYPFFDEEYFEWVDLLESVVAARGSYTMIELGAGHGRWVVRAAHAVKQHNPELPCHLIAVEGEPTVFEWMRLHFLDNGIDPARHTLIHGAVTEQPGDVLFYMGGPRGGPFDLRPDEWYGQAVTKDQDLSGDAVDDGEYRGHRVLRHESGWRSIRVPAISLRGILKDLDRVDLIDMDIEGQELPVIRASIKELDAKVGRLHIGTHSREIESELRRLMLIHGWRSMADYTLLATSQTPWGEIRFENGVQSWVNPGFAH
jgi:FkbM family methyltransferase